MCRPNLRLARSLRLAVASLAVFVSTPLFAQQPPPPAFVVGKLADSAEAPVIDGKVNEAVWQTVQPYASFTQQDPIEGAPPARRLKCA